MRLKNMAAAVLFTLPMVAQADVLHFVFSAEAKSVNNPGAYLNLMNGDLFTGSLSIDTDAIYESIEVRDYDDFTKTYSPNAVSMELNINGNIVNNVAEVSYDAVPSSSMLIAFNAIVIASSFEIEGQELMFSSVFITNANNAGDMSRGLSDTAEIFGSLISSSVLFEEVMDGRDRVFASADIVDVQAVPVPAAAWLFGSAMIGLVGLRRSK
ncbi:VPLPA-CTERM sorting domain-containing protein [bacterium]|nr:VPLPA-CTERM sorting domain-containing protein [bacterium]